MLALKRLRLSRAALRICVSSATAIGGKTDALPMRARESGGGETMSKTSPSRRGDALRVVIAGGGVPALEATLALRALAEDRVALHLVAPEREFVYRPLAVVEPFRVGEVERFSLQALTEAAGAELHQGVVTSVDPERHVLATEDGQELWYDVLLLALGARPRAAVANALTFRGAQDGPALAALLAHVPRGARRSRPHRPPRGGRSRSGAKRCLRASSRGPLAASPVRAGSPHGDLSDGPRRDGRGDARS